MIKLLEEYDPLYHITYVLAAIRILETDILRAYDDGTMNGKAVCLTRNSHLTFGDPETMIKFKLDKNLLSHKYKIIPEVDYANDMGHRESEERVHRDIINVSKYIMEIDLTDGSYELALNIIKGTADGFYDIEPEDLVYLIELIDSKGIPKGKYLTKLSKII